MRTTLALCASTLALMLAAPAAHAQAGQTMVQTAQDGITLGQGKGMMLRLPRPITDMFVGNPGVADVQVKSPTQVYLFGTGAGETTIYATDRAGKIVYSATVRVAQNIDSIKQMLGVAMPDSTIEVTPLNGMVLLSGTVASPGEVEEAARLVGGFLGGNVQVINKLKTATPLQVNLRVKIVEVGRNLVRELGVNLLTRDTTNGFAFGLTRGRTAGTFPPTGSNVGGTFNAPTKGTGFGFAGRLAGLDLIAALDLLEQDGAVTTLAEPNLTALSGETASFLAGGEFPIVVSSGLNGTSVEFKEYGVGLAFTPTVLDGNRISMRVRPEVSELSDAGSVIIGGTTIPALSTRRAETTVELGSGQSFMIAGLLRNNTNSSTEKTPLLGDLPILGALFKSEKFRRDETELVIVITPYLVKPVSADKIRLPSDGSRAPSDLERWFLGRTFTGQNPNGAPAGGRTPAAGSAPAVPSAASAAPAPGFSN
jgi:pilus assembly protein CpaC